MKPSASPSTGVLCCARRHFLKSTAFAGVALTAAPYWLRSQDAPRRLNVAVIGAAGKGAGDTDAVASENIVALCDADGRRLAGRLQKYPHAKGYQDYRKLFDELGQSLDAVVVSTPDHHHALASAMAMQLGKHVFCQKPLAQNVHEARLLRRLAAEKNVVTQMGNQGSASDGLRRAVEVVQAGVLGAVRELHVWSNRPIWPQGLDRPEGEDPIPADLNWDAWIGPAPMRPFKVGVYHPFKWRGWLDFGTGALGDMACHTVNLPFRALKLGYPEVVECEAVSGTHAETYPKSSRIRFEFPARDGLPALKFWWYDGGWKPAPELTADLREMHGKLPGSGCLMVGDQGTLFSPDDYGSKFYLKLAGDRQYLAGGAHEVVKDIPQTLLRCRGGHVREWLDGIRGGPAPYSNFGLAGHLTEVILLGCVAVRHGVGQRIEWDGPNATAKDVDVGHLLRRAYRQGWELPV